MAAPITQACLSSKAGLVSQIRRCFSYGRTLEQKRHVRVRFAPSPTGLLHLGGLRTALFNYLFAKSHPEGKFILRIEDTDQTRLVQGAVKKLEDTLDWAGLTPDEGPSQGGNHGPYTQSQRIELYQESIKSLLQNGTAYHCFCTPKRLELLRKDAARRGETPKYDNRCRHWSSLEVKERLARNTPFVIRFKLEPITDPFDDMVKGPCVHNVADIEGDPVLIKSDNFPTYHFANVVDDHHMNITHVLRGDEWQASTPKHILLYKAFGWDPPRFAHLPLILNKDGTKLSKRQDDIRVEYFKEEGYFPEAVLNYITKIGGGFSSDGTTGWILEELVQRFSIDKVRRNSGRLDPEFLNEANKAHLHKNLQNKENRGKLIEDVRKQIHEFYQNRLGDQSMQDIILSSEYIGNILDWTMHEGRVVKTKDLLDSKFEFLWTAPLQEHIQELKSSPLNITQVLEKCVARLESMSEFEMKDVGQELRQLVKEEGAKTSVFMHNMRQALSGLKEGPPVAEMMTTLGRENTLHRLKYTLNTLSGMS